MKRTVLTLICLLTFFVVQAIDINPISNAFKAGNAAALASSMDQEVDIAVPGSSKKGNGAEAVAMLNQFFGKNKPTGFTILHHADKKENGFLVGKMTTASGEFRVNITYRADNDKVFIQSIRIE